ncbi:PQQ-dependent sugar dehydrogenase, partial [Candidatus Gracilibacteria bacterium]|nr:PQQ-dependent sugar dehydrogenase [Candidatus Gracilibacteria bacterium]
MTFAPDGRIFVAQKGGTVQVIKNGVLLNTPLITLTDVNNYGDRGLIGIAIDPNFTSNGYLYLSYTYENSPGTNIAGAKTGRIVRITVNGDRALESSKLVILGTVGGTLANPSCQNYSVTADCIPSDNASHSVGGLAFGIDGKLYATLGDGASFDYADPRSLRSQNLESLAGKLVRINRDGTAPSDNPYYTGDSNANASKVWALGLRNMFRFVFQPGSNTIFAGDVGWNTWEEINVVNRGNNLGWPCYEGSDVTAGGLGCSVANPIAPFYFYRHDAAGAGSITGGDFLGSAFPIEYRGSYVYGDYAQNFLKLMRLGANNTILSQVDLIANPGGPVDIKAGPDGHLYYIAIYTGEVKRINYTQGNRKPIAVPVVSKNSGVTPLAVIFSASGSSDPDGNILTYNWDFGDGGTATGVAPSHVYTIDGSYDAVLTVNDGSGGIDIKSIRIFAGNQRPSAAILNPSNGAIYRAGDRIVLSGTGSDPETGTISGSGFAWQIFVHHNTHIHYLQAASGTLASFIAPDHSATDVYVEVVLTVTDPTGIQSSSSVNMYLNNGVINPGNLIQNPGLESNTLFVDNPDNWIQGWFGNNDQIWTYPIFGDNSQKAGRVEITRFVSGDAKWAFDPVSVDENSEYVFSDSYRSSIVTDVIVDIGYADGRHTYHEIGNPEATANWKSFVGTSRTPPGAKTATVFHRVMALGWLDTDNYIWMKNISQSLPPIARDDTASGKLDTVVMIPDILANDQAFGSGNLLRSTTIDLNPLISEPQTTLIVPEGTFSISPSSAIVIFTPADGFSGRVTIPYSIQDTLGQTAQASIIVNIASSILPPTPNNLIVNPSVETANASGNLPLNWNQGGYGNNTAIFAYPSPGIVGNKSIEVSITNYSDGDTKW